MQQWVAIRQKVNRLARDVIRGMRGKIEDTIVRIKTSLTAVAKYLRKFIVRC